MKFPEINEDNILRTFHVIWNFCALSYIVGIYTGYDYGSSFIIAVLILCGLWFLYALIQKLINQDLTKTILEAKKKEEEAKKQSDRV